MPGYRRVGFAEQVLLDGLKVALSLWREMAPSRAPITISKFEIEPVKHQLCVLPLASTERIQTLLNRGVEIMSRKTKGRARDGLHQSFDDCCICGSELVQKLVRVLAG